MKRILSLALALMLLTLCPAMAAESTRNNENNESLEMATETQAAVQTLVSPDGSYSFEAPAEYFTLSTELFKTIFAQPEAQELLAQMLGLADASQLAVYFDALAEANMMIVYSGDMGGNLNVQLVQSALTMNQIVLLKDMMDEAMLEQYVNLGIAAEDVTPMEIQEIGGRLWYGTKVLMMGMDMLSMVTVENGVQYTITFTAIDEAVARRVLETFTIVPAAE